MENLRSSINLTEIVYPVYKIGNRKPITDHGLTYYITTLWDEDNQTYLYSYSIIDDKNIAGNSLALRRLKLLSANTKLHKLSKAAFFLGDLVKLAKPSLWFMDAAGTLFQYHKNLRVKLEVRKIKQLIPILTGGVIVEIEGISGRFKSLYTPSIEYKYAGIIQFGMGHIFFGFYKQKYDTTWRLI